MRRVLVVGVVVACGIALAAFPPRRAERSPRQAPTAVEPHDPGVGDARILREEPPASLAASLAKLRELRRARQTEDAKTLLLEIRDRLRDGLQDTDGLWERAQLLYDGLRKLFVGTTCDQFGEALYYKDRCVLAADELAVQPVDGVRTIVSLFERGLPEEHTHVDERTAPNVHHAECLAMRPVLAALKGIEIREADARALLDSGWTRGCRLVRDDVLAALYPGWSSLIAAVGVDWLKQFPEPNLAYFLCAALLRAGRTDDVLALVDREKTSKLLVPLLQAIAVTPDIPVAFDLIETVRQRLESTTSHSVVYQTAMSEGYGALCKRAVQAEGAEACLARLLKQLDTGPEQWTSRRYDVVMSGISTARAHQRLEDKRDLFAGGSVEFDQYARRLADHAVRAYTYASLSTDGLNAVASVSATPDLLFDTIRRVLAGGNRHATIDALIAVRVAQDRGLLRTREGLEQAGRMLAELADHVDEGFPAQDAYLRAVRDVNSRASLAAVERFQSKIESRLRSAPDSADLKQLAERAAAVVAALRK